MKVGSRHHDGAARPMGDDKERHSSYTCRRWHTLEEKDHGGHKTDGGRSEGQPSEQPHGRAAEHALAARHCATVRQHGQSVVILQYCNL